MECIDKNSFNQSELINDIFLGWNRVSSVLGREDLIVEGFAAKGRRAKYFTVNVGDKIGPDSHKDQLFLELFYNNDCDIYVHDPRFFTLSSIPEALPALKRQILVNKTESHFYTLEMTEVEELDIAEDPCNNAEEYNFQVCTYIDTYLQCKHFLDMLLIKVTLKINKNCHNQTFALKFDMASFMDF